MLIDDFPPAPLKKAINLCYYVPQSDDKLSEYLINFKEGHAYSINEWIKYCLSELSKKEKIKRLGKTIEVDILPPIDLVVRALGSLETVPISTKPTHKLASSIAAHLNSEFIPDLLIKSRVTKKFAKGLNKAQREKEIEGVYSLKPGVDLNNKSVLIVDDISTSHVTARAIGKVIRAAFPAAKIYFLALGQTERGADLNADIFKNEVEGKYFKDL